MSRKQSAVWVIENDTDVREFLSSRLVSRGYDVLYIDSREEVLYLLDTSPPPLLIMVNIEMLKGRGLELLDELQQTRCRIPAIVLSDVPRIPTVVEAMRMGALDYLVKPIQATEFETAIARVVEIRQKATGPQESLIASSNPEMLRISALCDKVADADVPVLILGESGVGKEVVGRYIHERSGNREPFIKVNCAALPSELLESELFGHERGAFTGAVKEKPGKFELAGRGTIMLDEVAEMQPGLQAKLLHVLQDGEYCRLGGVRALRSEARIIAATNRDLTTLVARREFREDLYFRLNVVTIEIPPLRNRPEDIGPLCDFFVQRYRSKYKSTIKQLPPKMAEAVQNYYWPGNVRQLENFVKRFLILRDVDQAFAELRSTIPNSDGALRPKVPATVSLRELASNAAEQTEKDLIFQTLHQVKWNRKKAAKQLGICYKSLLNKLNRWKTESDRRMIM